jgi:hypothetical protein
MKIKTVKKIGEKYLINSKILVPLDEKNKYYNLLSLWLDKNKNIQLMEDVDDNKMSEVETDYAKKRNEIESASVGGDRSSVDTWPIQHLEALLHLYVKEAPTPFLDGLSEARGETKRVLAKKILGKSSDYLYKLGKATGQMQVQKKSKGE